MVSGHAPETAHGWINISLLFVAVIVLTVLQGTSKSGCSCYKGDLKDNISRTILLVFSGWAIVAKVWDLCLASTCSGSTNFLCTSIARHNTATEWWGTLETVLLCLQLACGLPFIPRKRRFIAAIVIFTAYTVIMIIAATVSGAGYVAATGHLVWTNQYWISKGFLNRTKVFLSRWFSTSSFWRSWVSVREKKRWREATRALLKNAHP